MQQTWSSVLSSRNGTHHHSLFVLLGNSSKSCDPLFCNTSVTYLGDEWLSRESTCQRSTVKLARHAQLQMCLQRQEICSAELSIAVQWCIMCKTCLSGTHMHTSSVALCCNDARHWEESQYGIAIQLLTAREGKCGRFTNLVISCGHTCARLSKVLLR